MYGIFEEEGGVSDRRAGLGAAHLSLGVAVLVLLTLSATVAIRGVDRPLGDEPTLASPPSPLPVVIEAPETAPLTDGTITLTASFVFVSLNQAPAASTPTPVPSPPRTVAAAAPTLSPASPLLVASPPPAPDAPASSDPPIPTPGPEESPPPPSPSSAPPPMVSAGASFDPGTSADAVVNVAITPQPDADVTVGSTQLVGDADPAEGTGASIGGTLVPESVNFDAPSPTPPVPATSALSG